MTSIVIKGDEGRINFGHALAEMFATRLYRMSTVEFVLLKHFASLRFDSNLFVAFTWD